jgi:hypothetical protein
MKHYISLITLLISSTFSYAQVGIGTSSPAGSSQLDVSSTTKGLLPPRMTTNQRDLILSPATGLQIYNTDNRGIETFTGTSGEWLTLGRGKSGSSKNTALGVRTLNANTSGNENTAIGWFTLHDNTTGSYNTAVGRTPLYKNTSGSGNTATGYSALFSNTTANNNTATGYQSLYYNTTGYNNTANGYRSLYLNTTGHKNNALGYLSLYNNTTGYDNIGIGNGALYSILSTFGNVGIGHGAGDNYNGYNSVSIGWNAGGMGNGNDNIYIGTEAHYSSNSYYRSVALGYRAYVTGNQQFRVSHNIFSVGGWVNWSNVSDARMKKNVSSQNVPGLNFVLNLTPVTYQLDEEAHKTWHIENHFDGKKPENYDDNPYQIDDEVKVGFIAQDVEKTAEDLGYQFSGVDKPDNDNDLYGIRYASFVVPLVKAVQEQQVLIDKQQATIEQQKSDFQNQLQLLLERIEALEN